MRRGHQGIGGWRNENPRHFRPRTGGSPRFRPPSIYPYLDVPRFPPPGPRQHRPPRPYNPHAVHSDEHGPPDHHDRNNYRNLNLHQHNRLPDRSQHHRSRQPYPYSHPNVNREDSTQGNQYKQSSDFYTEGQGDTFQINSLGDIDHRQPVPHNQDSYNPHRINPWNNDQRPFYEDVSPQKYYRHHEREPERQPVEGNRIPSSDYTGHRPPSSDYYGSTSSTTINNNNTAFSRSVDDTVDIIRKRMLNRNDPQRLSQDTSLNSNNSEQEATDNVNPHTQHQEQPTKKRIQRHKQNVKSNCDKMKSNIVHQLFKMDKDKMHKLMDDPGSSSKFEYAISSLITESQNSLNRHLRSVAEKSLVSTSSDFIHNDNNTIYEDTFMKQMQCILDPQDTVLLEDIKPLVMAELHKVLQLDDFDPRNDLEDQNSYYSREDQNYAPYGNLQYEDFPKESFYDIDQRVLPNYEDSNQTDLPENSAQNHNYENQNIKSEGSYNNPDSLFARRPVRKSQDRRQSVDNQRSRRSIDNCNEDIYKGIEEPLPLFDTNAEHLSEDEDTFAELDKQYHVAIDHNFLDDVSARTTPNPHQSVDTNPIPNVKNEREYKQTSFSQSPPQLYSASGICDIDERQSKIVSHKPDILQSPDFPKENSTPVNSENISVKREYINVKQEHSSKHKEQEDEDSRITKSSRINSRKRSMDQRPSHRKEKRKKNVSCSSDTGNSSLHRHDHSSSKYRHSKSNEKCNEAPKPYYSIFTSAEGSRRDLSRDNKRRDMTEKDYSDKYVKRKGSRKSSDRDSRKNRGSSSSSLTILSPKDSSNNSNATKLKTIDMFTEQPKKVAVHQAHRNTAPTPVTPKITEEPKTKLTTTPTKSVATKHISTQVIKRVISKETQTFDSKCVSTRYSQTERKKYLSKGIQTPKSFLDQQEPTSKAKEPLERMKEIDMEIQVLLQEKFKLYHNLESKESCPSSIDLGMTVLNVTPLEDDNDNKEIVITDHASEDSNDNQDAIVDDFTSIPVEELEQIAFESVEEINLIDSPKTGKRGGRQKSLLQERKTSESPQSTSSKKSNKARKTPKIALIERIIEDGPIDDVISLDSIESPSKHKKKPKSKPKKKSKKSKMVQSTEPDSYDIKECSVVLIQTDISKYLKQGALKAETEITEIIAIDDSLESKSDLQELDIKSQEPDNESQVSEEVCIVSVDYDKTPEPREIVEETVVNDLQFDMLDVSEDIVIGESYEIKDKDSEPSATINEELILDNSQSSADDVFAAEAPQAEPECKTYDYSTDEELRRDSQTVMGNVDAVLAIECIDNNFVAACLDGNVYHFSGDGQLLNTMRGSNLAVTCLTIVREKYGTTVYTGSLDSRIRYYDLDTGLEKGPECNVLSPIQTMDRAWDTVFVGTRTGFVLQFECKNNMLIPVSTVKFSEQAILALRAMKEGPRKVLLVASRSENVTVKDAQTGLLLRTLVGPKMTVYTLLFEDGKVYCGTSSHQIHVFDYASGSHTGCHEGGKGAVCLRATGGLLFAGCYDGCVYIYREGETRPIAQLRGPGLMLLSLAILGSKIIAGYKDRSLYIWKIPLSILQEMIL